MTEPEFIILKLERPRKGELLLVHDIAIGPLEKLAKGKRRLSRDGHREDATAVYAVINRPELRSRKFACVTAYIESTFQAKPVNESYGRGSKIALIIDISAVRDRLLIFNGDIGRLGKALGSGEIQPSFIRSVAGSDRVAEIVAILGLLHENTRKIPSVQPRLHGISFEGRLFDGINPSEIAQICI